jgi:transposase-like protein
MYKAKKPQLMVSQKLSAIEDYLEGRGSYQEIAEAYNVSHVTILNWVAQKDSLIAECLECARMYPEALNLSIVSEGESPTKLSNEKQLELLKENRRLKIEESRKEDHIAYLESLLELNNIDPNKMSKKKRKKQLDMPKK